VLFDGKQMLNRHVVDSVCSSSQSSTPHSCNKFDLFVTGIHLARLTLDSLFRHCLILGQFRWYESYEPSHRVELVDSPNGRVITQLEKFELQ